MKACTAVINSAEAFVSHAKKHFTLEDDHIHSKRTFHYVKSQDILRNRPHRKTKTLPGTRGLHSIKGVAPYEVEIRNLSCFCHACMNSNYTFCENNEYVNKWKHVGLKKDGEDMDVRTKGDKLKGRAVTIRGAAVKTEVMEKL